MARAGWTGYDAGMPGARTAAAFTLFIDGHTAALTAVQSAGTGGLVNVTDAGGGRGVWTVTAGD